MTALPFWQQRCFQDRVNIWRVAHPGNVGTGEGQDDVVSLAYSGIKCYLEFADNVGLPTEIGKVRSFSIRRATICHLTANQECGPDWFIQDVTPQREPESRLVYRVQEQPPSVPSLDIRKANWKPVLVEHDPHPPEEIV